MILGIDGRAMLADKKAGIGVYTTEIIKNLNFPKSVFLHKQLPTDLYLENTETNYIIKRYPFYRWRLEQIWEIYSLPVMARKSNLDLFWGPRFFVPPGLKIPSVATIHDIAYLKFPDIVSTSQRDYFNRLINLSIKNASHFICVSETSKKDFCEYFGVKEEKVSVVYNGYNPIYNTQLPEQQKLQILNKFVIPEKFILFLGTLEPRKNLSNLVTAYTNSDLPSAGIPLVIAGKIGWMQSELLSEIEPLMKEGKVILTGYLSEDELRALYQSCMFFTFPSLYEGFGIPVLEAMASGAPVLCSGNSALGELFDKVAEIVNPFSVESIKIGLNNLLFDSRRNELNSIGKKFVSKFSWSRSADEHLKVFKAILS
jgi:glycosyltransferase involved in cell wall biosynthesis